MKILIMNEFHTSLINLCCLTVLSPVNSGAITFTSNIAPHPPKNNDSNSKIIYYI